VGTLYVRCGTRFRPLRDKLQAVLLAAVPCSLVTGDESSRTPNTLNIAFEYIEGGGHPADAEPARHRRLQRQCLHLRLPGALPRDARAMGIPYTAAHGSVRFSLSRYTREREIDYVIEKLPPVIERLCSPSPYWLQNKPQLAEFAPAYG